MKYSNKLELVEAIKNNADLFIKEYSDIKESSINIDDEKIGYTPFQKLSVMGSRKKQFFRTGIQNDSPVALVWALRVSGAGTGPAHQDNVQPWTGRGNSRRHAC